MKVKKRNGRLEEYCPEKINNFVNRCCEGLKIPSSEIIIDAEISFRDKIPTSEIDEQLELTARSKIWKHPDYGKAAARMLLSSHYKEVISESVDCDAFDHDYRSVFVRNIKKGVKAGLFDPRLLSFPLKELADYMEPSRDELYGYVGIKNLTDRYFARIDGKVIETPQAFHMRVAMGLCLEESNTDFVYNLYDLYSTHKASPSTPTLFNSGTTHPQLSSCYLSSVDDSVDGIFDGLWQEARKSKYAGGLGFHMTAIRSTGSRIKGTNGTSSGLIPWLKIYNDMLVACNQAGRRPGSGCVYLEPWHGDIEEFITLRTNTGDEQRKCRQLNIALWMPDLFFERLESDSHWTLFDPSLVKDLPELYGVDFKKAYERYEAEGLGRQIQAKALWKEILKCLFETSHPWICFKDRSNECYSNKHMGLVHGSNLCSEIILRTQPPKYEEGRKTEYGLTAVCTLSSICLPNHMLKTENGWSLDYDSIFDTIQCMVRALDNVISVNFYPTEEARIGAESDRPIGIGTIGWADVYARMGVSPDSEEALTLANTIMEKISFFAIDASAELAAERGSYPTFEGSSWSAGKFHHENYGDVKCSEGWGSLREKVKRGMRNSNLLAIAPNASIGFILGYNQSIEPYYSAVYTYGNKSGRTIIINERLVEDLEEVDLWNIEMAEDIVRNEGDVSSLDIPDQIKSKYKTAFQCNQEGLVKVNAARQKWVDQAISFNLYNDRTSLKYLNDIYLAAWKNGLKTTYYLRNKRANSTEKMIEDKPKQEVSACPIDGSCESCEG
jgi:ribonucleoside-diphosphate reductase alpha chain